MTTTEQLTKADQLRHCAEWLDRNEVARTVSVCTAIKGPPTVMLSLDDLRRCFPGADVKKIEGEHATTYMLESDGIEFKAFEYPRRQVWPVESVVKL